MPLIDFASRPPLAEFAVESPHMSNYRRVYATSERTTAQPLGQESLDSYLRMYERLGVTCVVIKARDASSTLGFRVSNEVVSEFCHRHRGFVGFAAVDPHDPGAVAKLQHAISDLGLKGLNVQGFEHLLPIDDPKLMALYEKCAELDIPVNVHAGMNFSTSAPADLGRPMALDRVCMRFPSLRICASPPGWPWSQELIAMAWRHPKLWIGLSAVRPALLTKANSGYEQLLTYGAKLLRHRIIFGSGYPMIPVERSVAEVRSLGLEEDVQRAWLHDNAQAFLQLT